MPGDDATIVINDPDPTFLAALAAISDGNIGDSPPLHALAALLRDHTRVLFPPPPARSRTNPNRTATPPPNGGNQAANDDDSQNDDDDDTDNDEEDEEDDDGTGLLRRNWHAIDEDKSVPSEDELKYIESQDEHSALDHKYWEDKTFLPVDDPEMTTVDQGRIDWLVEHYNGTKEEPNNQRIMRSPIVRIGGLDWQIKFYPRGNHTEYLSVYLECVSMLAPEYAEFEDFDDPPFPFLEGSKHTQHRRSVAAQISVVMYNPAEPRSYEFETEAHQYHKRCPDYGWKYFTQSPRYGFHMRQHMRQRQAILTDDKLAFSAFIRIVNDPTGSMWEHHDERDLTYAQRMRSNMSITGLRPSNKSMWRVIPGIICSHFKPFRDFARNVDQERFGKEWDLQELWKMYVRQRPSSRHGRSSRTKRDVVQEFAEIAKRLRNHLGEDDPIVVEWNKLLGDFDAQKGSVCGPNRLRTKEHRSVQAAVDHHPKPIPCPALLTLELQRHEHDQTDRKWKKLNHSVDVQDHITVNGHKYTLFGFVTHSGRLHSFRYNAFVRPRGIGKGWYNYREGRVIRLTEKQARDKHSGRKEDSGTGSIEADAFHLPFESPSDIEFSSAVMYVREDFAEQAFAPCLEESWAPPVRKKERPTNGNAIKMAESIMDQGEDVTTAKSPEPDVEAERESPDAATNGVVPIETDDDTTSGEPLRAASAAIADESVVPAGRNASEITAPETEAATTAATIALPVLMDGDDVVMADAISGTDGAPAADNVAAEADINAEAAAQDHDGDSHSSDDEWENEDDGVYDEENHELNNDSDDDDDDDNDENNNDDTENANKAKSTAADISTSKTTDISQSTISTDSSLPTHTIDWLGGPYYHGQHHPTTHQHHGHGHLISTSGNEYRGPFALGVPHGPSGTMTYATSGDIYTGSWRHGRHHGPGTLTEASTGNIFKGTWKRGKKTGAFVLSGTVTDDDRGVCRVCYENALEVAFLGCGHVVACESCADRVMDCPVCRRSVAGRVRLWGVRVLMG
jgi:hypothetical protein